jgi:hypothetical protein
MHGDRVEHDFDGTLAALGTGLGRRRSDRLEHLEQVTVRTTVFVRRHALRVDDLAGRTGVSR